MNLFYSDVDDTIALNSKISLDLKQYIKEMDDLFIPCSGRPLISMKNMFKDLNIKYLISFNGAQIYEFSTKKIIFNELIPLELAKKVTKTLKSLEVDFLIYDEKNVYSTDIKNEYSLVEAEICDVDIKPIKEVISTPKILGLCNPNKIDESISYIKNKYPNLEVSKSKPFFIEITLKGVTKGKAVLWLNNLLKIKEDKVFCFGDSDNDISMFDLNINKIAVENANENIKKRADFICDSCQNEGVLKYLIGRENE